jgi:hypothetical protein
MFERPWFALLSYRPVDQHVDVKQFAFALGGSATNVAIVNQSASS